MKMNASPPPHVNCGGGAGVSRLSYLTFTLCTLS